MTTPWIELDQYQDQDDFAGPGFAEYVWRALFACQVEVRPHQEWIKLRWGFNAMALFDEFLERQKLFLESQYAIENELGIDNPNHRTLAIRYINRPGEGLLLTVIGKIHGRTQAETVENALAFYREVKATFPYDYTLVPALSENEFLYMSGWDILDKNNDQHSLAQVKRLEIPISPDRNSLFLHGIWQSKPRAHEQIWRLLAASPEPVLLNIFLRSTVLYSGDRERLLKSAQEVSNVTDGLLNQKTFSALQNWNNAYTERRVASWKKFFYLQIHFASKGKIDENLYRITGTSLSLSMDNQSVPGYQVICPKHQEGSEWRKKLRNLDLIFSGSYLPAPRLAEVADMDEVFAVMRLPYSPPENGFPDVIFAGARIK